MNKIQESFSKIINQYVKETYPNDVTLKYLLEGIENFSDDKIVKEVDKPRYAYPISETILNEKDRIKEIMNKVLDVNFKPGTFLNADMNGAPIKKVDETLVIEETPDVPTENNTEE